MEGHYSASALRAYSRYIRGDNAERSEETNHILSPPLNECIVLPEFGVFTHQH